MSHYCQIAKNHPLHGPYHDHEYGFAVSDDRVLFERLVLEIFQAGLSWELMLKKRSGFREAFYDYDIDRIAEMGEADIERLLQNPAIVRNRLKIMATIHNAKAVLGFQKECGSFVVWLEQQPPTDHKGWTRHLKKYFKFMGPLVVEEFLMSIGYLPGAHEEGCPVLERIKGGAIQQA